MSSPRRRLFLLRHARASWARPGDADHDRPIAPRGERVLAAVAAEIDILLTDPLDLVLASTATRARATVEGVAARLSKPRSIEWRRSLYLAEPDQILAQLRELDGVETVLVCGHNPGLHQLALWLLDGEAPGDLVNGLPPAGLVVVDLVDDWPDIDAGSATLVSFNPSSG